MKSKIKKILALVLSMLMIVTFNGCKNFGGGDDDNSSGDGELIYDFEQWMPDFSGTHISYLFGRITLNTDANYVAHGSGSAKIEPEGGGWMYIQTKSDTFDYDYSNFTNVSGVQAKVYNATDEPMDMTMGFVSKVNLYDSFDRVGDRNFTLNPGWNTVTLELVPEIMCYMADVSNIEGISFVFPKGVYAENKQAVFYLDDVRLIKKDEANASTDDKFPYDFDTYKEEMKLVAFEDNYSDNFFIHENDQEMKVVNARSERNGQGERLGLPDESKPDDDYVLKISVDSESGGWTESGGLSGKILRDALSKVDDDILNEQGARIVYRIYATSNSPESEINNLIANFRFHQKEKYSTYYTHAGEYFWFNQWHEFEIPLDLVVSGLSIPTASALDENIDNVTLFTASYDRDGDNSGGNGSYSLYLSDFYIKRNKPYDVEQGKLINFQSDGVTEYIRLEEASEFSLVDVAATEEKDAEGNRIGAPYTEDEDHKGTQVLKVEIPEGVDDWDDTISIFPDVIRFYRNEFGEGLDENAKITFKMYVSGEGIDQAYGDLRAWYSTTSGQICVNQTRFLANAGWHTFTVPLVAVMKNSNFNNSTFDGFANTIKRFTFRGPVQTVDEKQNTNPVTYTNNNRQVARTIYLSDFYIDSAPVLYDEVYDEKDNPNPKAYKPGTDSNGTYTLVDLEQEDTVKDWIIVSGATASAEVVNISGEEIAPLTEETEPLTDDLFKGDTRVLKIKFKQTSKNLSDQSDTQSLFDTKLLQASLQALVKALNTHNNMPANKNNQKSLSNYRIHFKVMRVGPDVDSTEYKYDKEKERELVVNFSSTKRLSGWLGGNRDNNIRFGSTVKDGRLKSGEWKDFIINIGTPKSSSWENGTGTINTTTLLGGVPGTPDTSKGENNNTYNNAFGDIDKANALAENLGGIGFYFNGKGTCTEQTLYVSSIYLEEITA